MHGRETTSQPEIRQGDILPLLITDLNDHGQGVGRIGGMVVFADGGIPGDHALVRIERIQSRYITATLHTIVEPSADRVKPPCPVFPVCGGCTLQSCRYQAQLNFKRKKVCDQISRIGGVADACSIVEPVRGMTFPRYYRSKVQLPVRGSIEQPEIGFFSRRSHTVVDVEHCLIQHPIADCVRLVVREHLRAFQIEPYREASNTGLLRHILVRIGFQTRQVMVVLVINGRTFPGIWELYNDLRDAIRNWNGSASQNSFSDPDFPVSGFDLTSFYLNRHEKQSNVITGDHYRLLYGQGHIEEKIHGMTFRISPQAFFQVNPFQTEVLYGLILEMADLHGREHVLDLYCGTGSISLLMARKAGHVTGVELISQSVLDAQENAGHNGIFNTTFVAAAAEQWLPLYLEQGGKADWIVLDPPRKGCAPDLIHAVRRSGVSGLIYVSCNPATLARDLALLSDTYKPARIVPVDMFPHADSVESVSLLVRV